VLPRTLRGRLVAGTVLVALVVVAILVALSQLFLARASANDSRALARARAAGVAATVRSRAGHLVVLEGVTDVLDRTAWVFDDDGHLLDGSLPSDLVAPSTQLARGGRTAYWTSGHRLLYAEPIAIAGQHAVVVATVDRTPYERSESRTLWAMIALGALTVALAGVVAREVARRSLAVVRRMSLNADAWQEHDLDRRFDLGPPRDEISALGQTLDRMLDRIGAVLAAERRLTDEIAHELRNPLMVVRGEAQLTQLSGGGLRRDAAEAIIEAADRMEGAIRTLLDAARARDLGEGRCALAPAVRRAAHPDVAVEVPEGLAVAVPEALLRAIVGPLLDNARRYARSSVTVRAEASGAVVELRVLDDGPGIPPDDLEAVFQPGWSRGGGHGLGLAVVRRLAGAAGVDVRAVGTGHGEFVVVLPSAATTGTDDGRDTASRCPGRGE
jgi:signal transduction histidine kinase